MDIVLVNASVFGLPTSRRPGAIVYDGALDLDLWRPPGPDRELLQVHGDKLPDLLDKERAQLPGRKLALGQALRLHAGKLHCDYMIWVASRTPHGDDEQAPAPDLALLERVAESALELADKHHTVRVAFGALGAGPKAIDAADRLAALVRGANAFRTKCGGSRVPSIEEVLVCSASAADIARARRATERLAKQDAPPVAPRAAASTTRAAGSGRSSAAGSGGARSAPRASGGGRGRKRLEAAEIENARARAAPYDRTHAYIEGAWLIHPKFGVGQVQSLLKAEGMAMILFEDGEERRLLNAR